MLYKIAERVVELESQGKKIIKFNVGDPDQNTDPRIMEAAYKALKEGKTKYSSSFGLPKLREKLAEIHNVKKENVIITPGSKIGIFSLMYLSLEKGSNIIIPTPHWTAYELMAKNIGVEVNFLKTDLESEWQIELEKLNELIDEKTKMIILNNPNNPTSKAIKNFEKIIEIAKENGIKVLSDECYSDISFSNTKSILEFNWEENFFVNSFSKTFAMTGWRLGYVIADKEVINRLGNFFQITVTNVPVFIQEAGLKALELKKEISNKMREIYQKRVDLANKILSNSKLKFSKPDAPFYLFPKIPNLNSEEFALNLLEKGTAITPGTAFGDYREFFRLSLTTEENKIKEGLEKIIEIL